MLKRNDRKSVIKELKREKMPKHWEQCFLYEEDTELSGLTKNEFLKEISEQKKKDNPSLDSQQVVGKMLTGFGEKHTFHRKFNERHSDLHKEQVLGMQLYKTLAEDNDLWEYRKIKYTDHLHSHITYSMLTREERKLGDKPRIVSSSSKFEGDNLIVNYVFSDRQVKTKEFKGEVKGNGIKSYLFEEDEDIPDDLGLDIEFEKKLEKLIMEGFNEEEERQIKVSLETGKEIKLRNGLGTIKITSCEEM